MILNEGVDLGALEIHSEGQVESSNVDVRPIFQPVDPTEVVPLFLND